MRRSSHRVAIIGGGLSGLATAVRLRLRRPNLELALFESGSRLGGVIGTERCGDHLIDLGADMFATHPAAAIDLLRDLGVEERLILPKATGRGARIVHRGKLVEVPAGFVLMRATHWWPILTTPLLSPAGKLRLLAEPWIGRVMPPEQDDDLSVGEFVRRRLGSETLERLVSPLIGGIYTADISKLSMRATMGPLVAMEAKYGSLTKATWARRRSGEDSVERNSSGARYEQFRAFPGGMVELIDTLAAALPSEQLNVNASVESIRPGTSHRSEATAETGAAGWELSVGGRQERFDQVVLAVPPRPAAGLLSAVAPRAAEELAAIESASTAIVVVAARRSEIRENINTFGFVVPSREQRRILAGSFASNKFPGRAPDDHVLIRVFVGGALQPHLLKLSDDELIQLAREELADLIGWQGEPLISRVVRWHEAMPQYHVGHLARVARIETAMDQLPGLHLISNSLHGVGIAPVIQSAGKLAERICDSLD